MSMKHKMEARGFLIKHYWRTFKQFWQNRDKLGGNIFKEHEAEFLPAALEIQEKPVSPTLRITAKILIALIVVLIGWSIFGKMDIVVNATGEIIPHVRTKTIASVETASVRAIHVVEGQRVKRGDVLLELDASVYDTEHDKARNNETEATLQMARAKAMINAVDTKKPPRLPAVPGVSKAKLLEAQGHLDSQYRDFMSKLQRIESSIGRYSTTLSLATRRAADY